MYILKKGIKSFYLFARLRVDQTKRRVGVAARTLRSKQKSNNPVTGEKDASLHRNAESVLGMQSEYS